MNVLELVELLIHFVKPGKTTDDEVENFLRRYTDDRKEMDRAIIIRADIIRKISAKSNHKSGDKRV